MPKTIEQKRKEAEARHAERDARTPQEQLHVLRERGVSSGKEWDRLMVLVEEGKAQVVPDKPTKEKKRDK